MAYTTPAEVLQRMGHPDSASSDLQAKLVDAISAADKAIDEDTGRTFEPSTRTIELGGDGSRLLEVPDLISVTTLKIDDDDDGVFETTIDASEFELDTIKTVEGWPYELVRLTERCFPSAGKRRKRIEIVGSWGWSAVPSAINQASTLLAVRISQRPSAAPFGVQSFGDFGASYTRRDDPDYTHLIGPFTKPQMA